MLDFKSALTRWIPLLILTLSLLPVPQAGATTIIAVGMDGAPGIDGGPGEPGGDGGDGESVDANAVVLGEDNDAQATGGNGGVGGRGGASVFLGLPGQIMGAPGGMGGDGGDAAANAIVTGASLSTATATGGNGGDGGSSDLYDDFGPEFSSAFGTLPVPPAGPAGIGGSGGDALAIARTNNMLKARPPDQPPAPSFSSENPGPALDSIANSLAIGGNGGMGMLGAAGGDAEAIAEAIGFGHSEAYASAIGGNSSGPSERGGSALAFALAEGKSGFARAEAMTGMGSGPGLRAMNQALLPSRRSNLAQATYGMALADRSQKEQPANMAFITGDPIAGDQATALAGNAALNSYFLSNPGADMIALADWRGIARANQTDTLFLTTEFEITLSNTEANREILLAAFDISATEEDFVELVYELDVNGVSTTETFGSVAEVLAFFSDTTFSLGSFNAGDTIRTTFDIALEKRGRFDMGLALASNVVPEPGTGLLVGLGLIGLTLRRRLH